MTAKIARIDTVLEKPPGEMRLVLIKEACRYGRFGKDKCYQLIAAHKINAYKDGHITLVDLNSIDAYHRTLPRVVSVDRVERRRRR